MKPNPGHGDVYRVHESASSFLTSPEFMKAIFARQECGAAAADSLDWYCWNEGCRVRHLTVDRQEGLSRRSRLKCPGCGQPLEFRGYLRSVTLLPEAADVAGISDLEQALGRKGN